jgi:hypothetical protein
MRTLTLSGLIAAALAAVASFADTALADAVPLQSLPVAPAVVNATPPTAPEKIAASEHTEGLYPAILPEARRKDSEKAGYRYVQVFTTEKEAQTYAADGTLTSNTAREPSATRTCLARGGSLSPHLSIFFRTKPAAPPKASQGQRSNPAPSVSKASKEPPKDNVELIHIERLTQAADGATLDTIEAFLDLQTMGSRFVSKSSSKLMKVATGPNSLGVYAAREEKGGSQFLVTNPELPPTASDEDRQAQVQQLTGTANRLVAQMPSGVSAETGCGYVRFTLSAKPGAGQMATVLATAFLPPGNNPDDAGPQDELPFDTTDMSEERVKMMREMVHRQNRSQRARTLAVNLSFSQLVSEPAPLLSVTFGWAGKDQQLHF